MDLGAFLRVAWRFRLLLTFGLLMATVVALASVAKITTDGVSYRQDQTYLSASTLFVTQEGFPWGRSVLDEMIRVQNGDSSETFVPRYGDPGRYSGLAALYAELAKSDAVAAQVMSHSSPGERYESSIVKSVDSGSSLPMIYMKGYGPSAQAAIDMANRAAEAFRDFLRQQQRKSEIPDEKRVEVVVTQRAGAAEVFEARSYVRPVFLFLLIMMAVVALAFCLENLRPRTLRPPAPDLREAEQPARAA